MPKSRGWPSWAENSCEVNHCPRRPMTYKLISYHQMASGFIRLQPLPYAGWLVAGKPIQQRLGLLLHNQEGAVRWFEKRPRSRVIQKAGQCIKIARHVEQAARFGVDAKLGPGPDFKNFFKRADAARHGDEAIREFGHHGFALMH